MRKNRKYSLKFKISCIADMREHNLGYRETDRIFKIAKQTTSRHFKQIVNNLFGENKYTFKSLRSTFITMCRENNIPLHIIQSWVGHVEGSRVTEDVYTHAREDAKLFYFNKINN